MPAVLPLRRADRWLDRAAPRRCIRGTRGASSLMLGWPWGGLGQGALIPSAGTMPSSHWDELARAVGARV
eukprot:470956-Alexandrium_andersonii.AAC.1